MKLTPDKRSLVLICRENGWPIRRIAEALNISRPSVYRTLAELAEEARRSNEVRRNLRVMTERDAG